MVGFGDLLGGVFEAGWWRVEGAEICAEAALIFLASRKDKGGFWDLLGGLFSLFFLPKQVLGMGLALSWRSS
jgi:hypothetical protein